MTPPTNAETALKCDGMNSPRSLEGRFGMYHCVVHNFCLWKFRWSYHITLYWVCGVAKSLNHNNYQLGQFLNFIIQMNSWIKGAEMSGVCVLKRSTTRVSKRVCSRSCKMLKAPGSIGSTCWLLRRLFRSDSTHWSTRIRTRIALPLVRVSDCLSSSTNRPRWRLRLRTCPGRDFQSDQQAKSDKSGMSTGKIWQTGFKTRSDWWTIIPRIWPSSEHQSLRSPEISIGSHMFNDWWMCRSSPTWVANGWRQHQQPQECRNLNRIYPKEMHNVSCHSASASHWE